MGGSPALVLVGGLALFGAILAWEFLMSPDYVEKYNIPGWTRGPATLEVISPVKRELEVIALPGSVSGELETKLIDLSQSLN